MWKGTIAAIVFAVPVVSQTDCSSCDSGSGNNGPVDTDTDSDTDTDTDTTAPDPCAAYVGQGTAAEIAATPRAYTDLEQLAIAMDGGFTADQALYDRLVADIEDAWNAGGAIDGVGYRGLFAGDRLVLGVDANTQGNISAGVYDDWDCANDWYGLVSSSVHSGFVVLTFDGIFDVEALATEYETLPGVTYAEPDSLMGDGSTVCATEDGTTFHYVFDIGSGDCPAGCIDHDYYYFRSEGGVVNPIDAWSNDEPPHTRPDWVDDYGACD